MNDNRRPGASPLQALADAKQTLRELLALLRRTA